MVNYSCSLPLRQLGNNALGLNIEGKRPEKLLPSKCVWYNIVQVLDEPLKGHSFNKILETAKDNNYPLLEMAAGIDVESTLNTLIHLIRYVKSKHKNVLVHVHQYLGSTKLNEILEEKTNCKVILDKTNFYEYPVDYRTEYPKIDALISISQCAGFGLNAGSWIVPDGFYQFDTNNNILYTCLEETKNRLLTNTQFHAEHSCYLGKIVYTNGLWNPTLENIMEDELLVLDEEGIRVVNWVTEQTKHFDKSHDLNHAIKVAKLAVSISNNKKTLYLALLHDVCDHKYKSISIEDRNIWINKNIPDLSKELIDLLDKISFSKQRFINEESDPALIAVRDADRIEALGPRGIERCEEYIKTKNGEIPKDVITHCFDKLLRLLPEGYIVSEEGRKKALPLHNYIVEYVLQNLPKTNLENIEHPKRLETLQV